MADVFNFAVDRNGKRWSQSLGEGVMIPLDGQVSETLDGLLNASLMPADAEAQHGPLTWHHRPDGIPPADYRPKSR